ncbi:DUF402 domain-containing protein [Hoyosella sp. YIM 151337]|uniref:DUF402 domain-containing protein n=1 Tax=Hoyosella sp. YIM 151337 TaxID=2992742 RepID=UPI0022367966|nr:DUF402 domain-containing protein [Hoyosella sp. YIM 151337]MCW4355622.1 DUF402 domain-containing protein [Hoyosella sp. YIM 151337]
MSLYDTRHSKAGAPTPAAVVHVHSPKVEKFNLTDRTNTDPKGFVRPVDRYHLEPWGLYMGRPADHEQFHYLESWIIPRFGIRASIFHFYPAHERDQNFYVDIGDFTPSPTQWRSVDHYLDIVVRTGRECEVQDVDELLAAHCAGHISAGTAQQAFQRAIRVVDGIAAHGHTLEGWLAAHGMEIWWR